jgi:hypothetical protein
MLRASKRVKLRARVSERALNLEMTTSVSPTTRRTS